MHRESQGVLLLTNGRADANVEAKQKALGSKGKGKIYKI